MISETPKEPSSSDLHWIAVDWGTSNLRAWAIGSCGNIADRRSSASGMAKLRPHQFEASLLELVNSWLPNKEQVPVFACGMVGAKQGWVDAGYRKVPCKPIELKSLAPAPTKSRSLHVSIVPGLCQVHPADVMRGEETQVAGFLEEYSAESSVICMPGTHSKWVNLKEDKVESFRTFMTGELYSLISTHSVVRIAVASRDWREDIFLEAVEECLKGRVALAADIFGLRARSLISDDNSAALRSRLSGLLVGHELAEVRASLSHGDIAIIGSRALAKPYRSALEFMGCHTKVFDSEQVTVAGLKKARKLSG